MDKIIDIHNHTLPGVDDGAKTIDESISIIKYLKSVGITDIVLTSHYIINTKYQFNSIARKNILATLKERLERENIDVNLYLGNEVYLCSEVVSLLKKREIYTLNNSNYMLVELPLDSYSNDYPNILCDLSEKGIIPVIAHPERYEFIKKDKKRINELLEFDTLLQINVESLIGKYGRRAKKIAKWLLKKNLVSFVATDIHHVASSKALEKAYSKLKHLVSEDKFRELTYFNPKRVINNNEIVGNLDYFRNERSW